MIGEGIDRLITAINKREDIECFCADCHQKVKMVFEADSMSHDLWWQHYKCPLCCQYFDTTGRMKPKIEDLIEYNKK
jgi:hypothetical protein